MLINSDRRIMRSVLIFLVSLSPAGFARAISCNNWQSSAPLRSPVRLLNQHPILESLTAFKKLFAEFNPQDRMMIESLLAIKAYQAKYSSTNSTSRLKLEEHQEVLSWMRALALKPKQFDILESMGFGFQSAESFIQVFNQQRSKHNASANELWETYQQGIKILEGFSSPVRDLVLSQDSIIQENSVLGIISKLAPWAFRSMGVGKDEELSPGDSLRLAAERISTVRDRLIHRYYWAQKGVYLSTVDQMKENAQANAELRDLGAFYLPSSLRARTAGDRGLSAQLEERAVRTFPELFLVKGSKVPTDLQLKILANSWEPKVKFLAFSLLELSQVQDAKERQARLEIARMSYRRLRVLDANQLGEERFQIEVFQKAEELARTHWPHSMKSEIWNQMREQVGGVRLQTAAKPHPLIGISGHAWSPEMKKALDSFAQANHANGHGENAQTERRHIENLLALQFYSNLFHPREALGDPTLLLPLQNVQNPNEGLSNKSERSEDQEKLAKRRLGESPPSLWSKEEAWMHLIEAYLDPFSNLSRSKVAVLSAVQRDPRISDFLRKLAEIYRNQHKSQGKNSNGLVFSNSSELKGDLLRKIGEVSQRVKEFSRDRLDSSVVHTFVVLLKAYEVAPLMGRNSFTIERLQMSDKESVSSLQEWGRQLIEFSEIFKGSHLSEERLTEAKNLLADELILWMVGQLGIQFSREEIPRNGDGYFEISVKLQKIEDRLKNLTEAFFRPQELVQENRELYGQIRDREKAHRIRKSRPKSQAPQHPSGSEGETVSESLDLRSSSDSSELVEFRDESSQQDMEAGN